MARTPRVRPPTEGWQGSPPVLGRSYCRGDGHDVPVVIRTGAELARVVSRNPYALDDPTKMVVGFPAEEVSLGELSLGDLSAYLPDEPTLIGKEIYVSVPNGQGRSKLMEALTERGMPTTLTVRHWRTVAALAELAS